MKVTLAAQRLSEDLLAAIELRRSFYQRQEDMDFQAQDGTIYYAIDSNILHGRYINPLAVDKAPEAWSGSVFGGPNGLKRTEAEANVFDVVYEYILSALPSGPQRGKSQLLILPGHSFEARGAFRKVVENATRSTDAPAAAELEAHFRSLDEVSEIDDQEHYLDQHSEEIHRLLRSIERPHELFQEYIKRLWSGRFCALNKLFSDPIFRPALSAQHFSKSFWDLDERFRNQVLPPEMNSWRRKVGRSDSGTVRNDILALSALEKLNSFFRNRGVRVVLVTNSNFIAESGRDFFPLRHEDRELGEVSFSDLYIRNPRAFLFDQEIIVPTSRGNAEERKDSWSDIWLGELWKTQHHDIVSFQDEIQNPVELEKRVQQKALEIVEQGSKMHSELYDSWTNHMTIVNRAHNSTSKRALESVKSRLGDDMIDSIGFFRSFSSHMERAATDSWNDFFLASAQLGFSFIGVKRFHSTQPKRQVPAILILQSEEGAIIQELLYSGKELATIEEELFERLSVFDHESLSSDYVRTLIYSLLFALAERWEVAKKIAFRATQIAERLSDSGELSESSGDEDWVTGREAYYLCAVFGRLTAKGTEALTTAGTYLELAHRSLFRENEELNLQRGLTGLRFTSEELAQSVAKTMFQLLDYWSGNSSISNEILDSSKQALKEARGCLSSGHLCAFEYVRSVCESNARTNIFTLIFVLDEVGYSNAYDISELDELVNSQIEFFSNGYHQPPTSSAGVSHIDLFALAYAAIQTGRFSELPPELHDRLDCFLSGKRYLPDFSVMPYDEQRFKRMLNHIKSAVQKGERYLR